MEGVKELVGRRCACVFNLEPIDWPIPGFPAWVVVDSVDMPLMKLRSIHGGEGLWVNAAIIKTLRPIG